jgi:hypothetical protein
MAWYPGAQKLELQPESDQQPAIVPTQFILHSIAAPWTPGRIYEYWRDSTNLESHFGLGYDGSLAQFVGTETRADANMYANRRSDGTGAVSLESASNLQHTDPWTAQQVATIIRLGVWLHQQHGIPLRVCRSATDPGFGYHRLFPEWSDGGTACPGDARVRQFHDIVMPGIIAAASGQAPPTTTPAPTAPPIEEDDMPLTDADLARIRGVLTSQEVLADIAVAVRRYEEGGPSMVELLDEIPQRVWDHKLPRLRDDWTKDGDLEAYWYVAGKDVSDRSVARQFAELKALLGAQSAAITALAQQVTAGTPVDADALVARIEAAIAGIEVHLTTAGTPAPKES